MFREAGAECAERGVDGAVRGRGGAAAARRAAGPRPCPPQRGHGHHQVGGDGMEIIDVDTEVAQCPEKAPAH